MDNNEKSSSPVTDVQTHHSSSSHMNSGSKRGLIPCSESNINSKKQKSKKNDEDKIDQINETKEVMRAIKELTETVKNLQEILLTRPQISLKEEETLKKKKKPKYYASCCFDCEEAEGGNELTTIYVKGFEYLRPREEVKKELTTIFRSSGEITRVFVPIECQTGVPLGFAFVDLKNGEGNEKALGLNGCYLAGGRLEVMMARKSGQFHGFTNFAGCDRCISATLLTNGGDSSDDECY